MSAKQLLQRIGSSLEYLADRGEFYVELDAISPQTRYTKIQSVTHLDIVFEGRVIRVIAQDMGPHTHFLDEEGRCDGCGEYPNES